MVAIRNSGGVPAAHATSHKTGGTDPIQLQELAAPTAAVALNSQKITGLGTPTAATDAATKAYVDAIANGLDIKMSVRAATTGNITLSGTQTIDGVAVIALDRVLVKNQTTGANNGIYDCAAGAWSRSTDADASAEVNAGMFTFVEEGTTQADQGWVLATNNPITLGTTALVFTQFNGAASGIPATIVDAKGDLIVATAADTVARLPVGPNNQVLTTDSTTATGVKWGSLLATPDINTKGFRSINAYGAVQGVAAAQNTAFDACQAALVADGGGILFVPPGLTYLTPIVIKDTVRIQGAYRDASVLAFGLGDLSTHAISYQSDGWPTHLSNIKVYGPGTSSPTIGVSPCLMNGIKIGRGSLLEDVWVTNFNYGISMQWDHTTIRHATVSNCYASIEYPSSTSRGDQHFYECIFTNNMLAGVLVNPGNTIDHSSFTHCHTVATPFGVLRTGAHTTGFIVDSVWEQPAFENCGNGAFVDLSTGGQSSFSNWWVRGSGWAWNATYVYSALSSNYCIDMNSGASSGGHIYNGFYPFNAAGAAIGVYNTGTGARVYWGGMVPAMFRGNYAWFEDELGNVYSGGTPVTGSVSAGDILELSSAGAVRRATGTSATTFLLGVSMEAGVAKPLIQTAARASFNVLSETVASAGVPLAQKTGTYNVVGPASSYPSNPIIGYSFGPGGNAGATATVTCVMNCFMIG